jgi:hypothetical protein
MDSMSVGVVDFDVVGDDEQKVDRLEAMDDVVVGIVVVVAKDVIVAAVEDPLVELGEMLAVGEKTASDCTVQPWDLDSIRKREYCLSY